MSSLCCGAGLDSSDHSCHHYSTSASAWPTRCDLMSYRNSTWPRMVACTAAAASSITVPNLGLGIRPRGPRMRAIFATRDIMSGVAMQRSYCSPLPWASAISSISFCPPTLSAPAEAHGWSQLPTPLERSHLKAPHSLSCFIKRSHPSRLILSQEVTTHSSLSPALSSHMIGTSGPSPTLPAYPLYLPLQAHGAAPAIFTENAFFKRGSPGLFGSGFAPSSVRHLHAALHLCPLSSAHQICRYLLAQDFCSAPASHKMDFSNPLPELYASGMDLPTLLAHSNLTQSSCLSIHLASAAVRQLMSSHHSQRSTSKASCLDVCLALLVLHKCSSTLPACSSDNLQPDFD